MPADLDFTKPRPPAITPEQAPQSGSPLYDAWMRLVAFDPVRAPQIWADATPYFEKIEWERRFVEEHVDNLIALMGPPLGPDKDKAN